MSDPHLANPVNCPRCGGSDTVDGSILGTLALGPGQVFRARRMPLWRRIFGLDVSIPSKARACRQCGLLWTTVSLAKIARV